MLSPSITGWGRSVSLRGSLRGAGVNGLTVALQEASFPFAAGFHTVATARSNRNGLFRFAQRPVFLATRYRAVPAIAPQLASEVRTARVRSRVRVHRGRKTRRAVWLAGAVNPGLPTGHAMLQRRTLSGWKSVKGAALTQLSDVRSNYEFKVRRRKRARGLPRARGGARRRRPCTRLQPQDRRRQEA